MKSKTAGEKVGKWAGEPEAAVPTPSPLNGERAGRGEAAHGCQIIPGQEHRLVRVEVEGPDDRHSPDRYHDWQQTSLGCARCAHEWTGLFSLTYKQACPLGILIQCPQCGSRFGVYPKSSLNWQI